MIGWGDLLVGLGLAAVIEGALYALFPAQARLVWAMIAGMDEQRLRLIGLAAAAFGVLVVWMVRG